MLDFAIIGLPRSGTTWAANWLTTDRSICMHDPMTNITLDNLAAWGARPGKLRGVACTGLWMFPDWVRANVRNWLVVERPIAQVTQSLIDIGLGPMTPDSLKAFQAFPGDRVPMADLFKPRQAARILERLVGQQLPFDEERHELLTGFMVNPHFEGWEPDPTAVKDWMARFTKAARA